MLGGHRMIAHRTTAPPLLVHRAPARATFVQHGRAARQQTALRNRSSGESPAIRRPPKVRRAWMRESSDNHPAPAEIIRSRRRQEPQAIISPHVRQLLRPANCVARTASITFQDAIMKRTARPTSCSSTSSSIRELRLNPFLDAILALLKRNSITLWLPILQIQKFQS